MKKVAYIVEPRKHGALKFVLANFDSQLPAEYSLQIFHSEKFNYKKYLNQTAKM